MRYLGNKTKLLSFIEYVIDKYNIDGDTFADLFSGTSSVGDYFKNRYRIIANDYMYFASIIAKAKLLNAGVPAFKTFRKKYKIDPFQWLNEQQYQPGDNYFLYKNYTPIGDRMFFTEENALRIDGNRFSIEELYKDKVIDEAEYAFLLASLMENIMKVSNTSGTYQAFLKFWDNRALKRFEIQPLEITDQALHGKNVIFNKNTNVLAREIEGDIAYIDPPYTSNQYTNSYHVLETIARYDYPEIFGKTGRRKKRELSLYSNKQQVLAEFEDLFRQLSFKHILVSYSNQSLISLDDLVNLASRFAVNGTVHIETTDYREYSTNNPSYKGTYENLKEAIIYFEKDNTINKSPLNYSGSKDVIVPLLIKQLPKHVGTFVDMMGGAFNVGANIAAIDKVYYAEYNKYIYDIIEMLLDDDKEQIVADVESVVKKYKLCKKNKEAYIKLRDAYNVNNKSSLYLFVLQIYAFQNMIRFNSSQKMNTPVGNNEYCESIKDRILEFKVKTSTYELIQGPYYSVEFDTFPEDTVFYFDPPYYITTAEYNDGKRGLEGWDINKELELLNYLSNLNQAGYKFMLSNVVEHKGKEHHVLLDWVQQHGFNLIELGMTGIKYPRKEILITNYNIFI